MIDQSTNTVNRISNDAMPAAMKFVSELETLFRHVNALEVALRYTTYTEMLTVSFFGFEGNTIASIKVPKTLPIDFVKNTITSTGERYRFVNEEPTYDAMLQMTCNPLFS